MDNKNAKRLVSKSKQLEYYLTLLRRVAKYSLNEPEEKIINIMDTSGQMAMIRLYDKITNKFSYTVGNKKKYDARRANLTDPQFEYVRKKSSIQADT